MKKQLAIINFLMVIFFIAFNGFIITNGLHGNTINSLSDEYNNLFTPANYAFGIWSLIFIGLLAHTIHQLLVAYGRTADEDVLINMGYNLVVALVASSLWLFVWLKEWTGLSVIVMIVALVSLLSIVISLSMQIYDAPRPVKIWTWIPISLFAGWITVATVTNISAYLAKINFAQGPSETVWTALIIGISMAIYALVVLRRNMSVFGLVGVWAFIAIAVRHDTDNELVKWMAILSAALLLILIIYQANQRRKALTN